MASLKLDVAQLQNLREDNNEDNTPPVLVPLMAVGMSDIPGAVQLVGKDMVAYAYGRCICTFSTNKEVGSRMSEPLRSVRAVTVLETSPDHSVIAAGEQTADGTGPAIGLFNARTLERVATLRGGGVSTKYNSLCFSSDGVTLIGAGYDEEGKRTLFHLWDWQTSVLPATSGAVTGSLLRVTIDPKFHNSLVLQGPEDLMSLRRHSNGFRDQQISGLPKKGTCHYITHAWLPDGSFVVATSQRELLVVNLVAVIDTIKVDRSITSLVVMADSSLLVAQHKGLLSLFTRRREGSPYGKQADLQTPDNPHSTSLNINISHLSALSSEERVAVYIQNGPIYIINMKLPKTSVYKGENAADVWDQVLPNFHEAGIVSCSVAIKRDYLATASKDLTVRLWQFKPLRLIMTHMCHVAPMAVTMDPWAANLVVTYSDGCKYYNVVEGMLLEVGELTTEEGGHQVAIEKVQVAKFNPTGSLIAVVEGTLGKNIYVFSTLHIKQLAKLDGHHERVHDLTWSEDGLYLCSASDGQVITWQMDGFKRVQEDTSKGYTNDSLACTADFQHLVIGDNMQGLRFMATMRGPDGQHVAAMAPAPNSARLQTGGPSQASLAGGRGRGAGSLGGPAPQRSPANRQSLVHQRSVTNGRDTGDETDAPRRHLVDEVPELTVLGTVAVMQPSRTCLALIDGQTTQAVIGGGAMGRLRVAPLPPSGPDDYREYYPHNADVWQVLIHSGGKLVFSADADGGWIMHALLPHHLVNGAARSPRTSLIKQRNRQPVSRSPGGGLRPNFAVPIKVIGEKAFHTTGVKQPDPSRLAPASSGPDQDMDLAAAGPAAPEQLPPFYALTTAAQKMIQTALSRSGDDMEIISVRSVDVQLLKEAVREVREKMAKAAAEFEYKLYDKEKDLTRQFEGDILSLRNTLDSLNRDYMKQAMLLDKVQQDRVAAEAAARADLVARLQKQQETFDGKLASEIDRTNAAEREVARIKAKFGKRLWQLDDEKHGAEAAVVEATRELKKKVVDAKQEAVENIVAARRNMEVEMRMDSELNEEELGRVTEAVQKLVEEKEDKYMVLLSKLTLQTGINNKTNEENARLRVDNDMLKRETARLSEKLRAVEEELRTMHQAWMERDSKQKQQERIMSDMAYQLQQSELYTTLANTRIKELNEEIDPLRASKAEVLAQVGAMEGASLRALDTKHKILMEHNNLAARLDNTSRELKQVRALAARRDQYFQNFAAQLFRTMHNVQHQQWPVLFGKLYEDYAKGQDKADWRKYEEHDPLGPQGAYGDGTGAGKKEEAATQAEFEEQMHEMHQQLMHTEKMMSQMSETRERTEKARSAVIAKLMTENTSIMNELNTCKRELKSAQELGNRQGLELHTLCAALPSGSAGGHMLRASANRASMQSRPGQAPLGLTHVNSLNNSEAADAGDASSSHGHDHSTDHISPDGTGAGDVHAAASPSNGSGSAGGAVGQLPGSSPAAAIPLGALLIPTAIKALPAKPPSRLGDPTRTNSMVNPGLSPRSELAPRLSGALQQMPGAGAPSPPQRRLAVVCGIPEASPASPQVVTGNMPTSGWWLGDNNLFEVPSNMAILNGECTATKRPGTISSQGSRPATLSQQALAIRHDLKQREAAAAGEPCSSAGEGERAGGLPSRGASGFSPQTPVPGGGTGGIPMRPSSVSSVTSSPSATSVSYHASAQLHARHSAGNHVGSGAGTSSGRALDGVDAARSGERERAASAGGIGSNDGSAMPLPLRPNTSAQLASLPHGSSLSTVPRPTSQQSSLMAYLHNIQGHLRSGQQIGPQRAMMLGAGFRSVSSGSMTKASPNTGKAGGSGFVRG